MKRLSIEESEADDVAADEDKVKSKKPRGDDGKEEEAPPAVAELGEDLVFEVLKRADARTLAAAACVSKRWRRLAEDERLWEAVCTRHWANIGCGNQQLRAVVLPLGGFRSLHSHYLHPLRNPAARRPTAAAPLPPPPLPSPAARQPFLPARWGKDEVQLSLSLFSIGYFEKMNPNYRPGSSSGGGGSV